MEIGSPGLLDAWEAVKAGRLHEAREALSAYQPEAGSLWQYHYVSAMAEDDPVRAMGHLRLACIGSPEDGPRAELLLERAGAYLKYGYYHEAGAAFLSFLEKYPDSALKEQAHLGAAVSLKETGRLREALGHFERAGRSSEALYGKAGVLQALGWTKDAGEAYDRAFLHDRAYLESSQESLYRYGENLRRAGKPQEARELLEEVSSPRWRPRAGISLGLIALAEDDAGEALEHFRSSARKAGQRAVAREALLRLAETALQAGRREEAREALERVRLDYPYGKQYDRAVLMLSRLYAEDGRYAEAVALVKELIFRITPVKEALDEFESIVLEVREKDEELFVELWNAAGSWLLDVSREKALVKIAEGLKGKGEPFLEISMWLSEHGSPGARSRGLEVLADFYTEMKDIEAARECIERLKAMKAGVDAIARAEARILFADGDREAAAEKLMSLKELGPEDLRLLGQSLPSARDAGKAAAFYRAALKGADAEAEDYVRLADFYYSLGRAEEALEYYSLALRKEPANEWALLRQAALSGGGTARRAYEKLQRGGSVLGRYAGARLREMEIKEKLKGTL